MDLPDHKCLGTTYQMGVSFHDAQNNPVNYTGTLTISVTHPKGWVEWARDDPYWSGTQLSYHANTYNRGAVITCGRANPTRGTSVTVQCAGISNQPFALTVYSFGEAKVTASADGMSCTATLNDWWARGRATRYADFALPSASLPPQTTGPYLVAVPYASQSAPYLAGDAVLLMVPPDGPIVTASLSWPGPMVPLSPHYPPNDQDWNHYWGSGGWPPLACALQGRTRALTTGGDFVFNSQIVDLDETNVDANGASLAELLLGSAGDGIVQWRFD